MKQPTDRLEVFGAAVFALALGFSVTISVQAGEPPKSTSQPDQDVKDRAVPRMAIPNAQIQPTQPLQPAQPPPRSRQGFVRKGNQIIAQPGYELVTGSNNQVTARIAGGGGGGQGATMTCQCMHGTTPVQFETCTMVMSGTTTVTCDKGPKDTCKDSCAFSSTSAAPRGGRAMQ
jgi:hypothetical protein